LVAIWNVLFDWPSGVAVEVADEFLLRFLFIGLLPWNTVAMTIVFCPARVCSVVE